GYIRRELMGRLSIRKMPELRFIADDSIEYSSKIAHMLDELSDEVQND
ncbi:MAG: ribosome-binding factor A, partial [Clostridia bacterium]|nr:ribosome-binding factor A [Clostridia bacterium]